MGERRPKTFAGALRLYKTKGPHLGETPSPAAGPAVDTFKDDLRYVTKSNERYFVICVIALIVLFVGAFLVVLRSLSSPKEIEAVFTVTGVSFSVLFGKMVRLWKDKVSSDLILVLAAKLRPEQLAGIIDVLLRSYTK